MPDHGLDSSTRLPGHIHWVPAMLPFRNLVKQNSKFAWNQSLEDAFKNSKKVIIDLVQKGVAMFDKGRVTCLLQIGAKKGWASYFYKSFANALIFCPNGWCLIYVGSRFCTNAKCKYAPIEGEAAAIA